MRFGTSFLAAGVAGLAAVFSLAVTDTALAAAPASINVRIDTGPLTIPGNIPGDTTGDAVHYAYAINAGTGIIDSLPIKICITSQDLAGWNSFDIHIGVLGVGNLPGITLPGNITFTNTGALQCKTTSIDINSGPLLAGNYAVNVNMTVDNKDPGNTHVSLSEGTQTIHFKAAVLAVGTSVSCFLTDSSGNFLNDCSGDPANLSGTDTGRFIIVANKKNVEVATNPGQFYYNFIWRNTTGATQPVSVAFARTGVAPQGAQALHAWITNAYLTTITTSEFDTTNEIGVPNGSDDLVSSASVPAGSSLVVTYHLEWKGIGGQAPAGCATTCASANQLIRVVGTISGANVPEVSCTSTAWGWKK